MEEWKWAVGFEGRYEVSSLGRIRSFVHPKGLYKTPHLLSPLLQKNGYYKLFLGRGRSRWLHILVAHAFVPNPNGLPTVNHRDGVKRNCHATNSEWTTHAGNMRHAYCSGLMRAPVPSRGVDAHNAKFTDDVIKEIRSVYRKGVAGLSTNALAIRFGTTQSNIHRIVTRQAWRHVS
jgi:hypothetical protein